MATACIGVPGSCSWRLMGNGDESRRVRSAEGWDAEHSDVRAGQRWGRACSETAPSMLQGRDGEMQES